MKQIFIYAIALFFLLKQSDSFAQDKKDKGKEKEKDMKEWKDKEKGREKEKEFKKDKDDKYHEKDRVEIKKGEGDNISLPRIPNPFPNPFPRTTPRNLTGVPKGHYPPPGECKIWYPDRPAGHQPPPVSCSSLIGAKLTDGAFILHGDKAYDSEYNWSDQEKRKPGSVAEEILKILFPNWGR